MTAEHTEEHVAPRWGIPDAIVTFVIGFFTAQVVVAIVVGAGVDIDSMTVTVTGLVALWAGLLGGMVWVTRRKGSGSFAADFGLRFEDRRDLVGMAYGLVTQLVVIPTLYLPLAWFIKDLGDRVEAPARNLSDQAGADAGLVLLAVLVIVGAPIVEELFYRGFLLRSIERRYGTRVGIGASATLFALAHFEAIQFPALLVFGLVLGYLAVRYNRLGPGIFAHAAFNAVTMAILIATR